MWKDIHILLLGEPQVGKTSLILSLVSEEFPEGVPTKVEEITIPADVTPEKVPTYIVDYSEVDQPSYQLCEEVGRANVVCLVYDLTDLSTLERVKSRWLPLIREYCMQETMLPVVLVGNKSDLISDSKIYEAMPVMNEFPEIETCIECSAKTLNNVSEMFYFAQKAVLHPTAPLYSAQDGYLKAESKIALTRIFKLCDSDNDGVLNDGELSHFQKLCFNTPLASQALQDVKNVVRKNCPDGVYEDNLTLDGFLYLHLLFIQRGRHETTWAVLRKFGYNDNLTIAEEYLMPDLPVQVSGSVPQLTNDATEFLIRIFHKYDADKDGALNQTEMNDLFSVFPYEPWGPDVLHTVCTNHLGWITQTGFMSQWMLTTYLDVPRTLEYLGYLGYSTLNEKKSQSSAVVMAPNNQSSTNQQNGIFRNMFSCKVVGSRGCGKTSFLRGLIEKSNSKVDNSHVSVIAVNEVSAKNNMTRYLLLHEVDAVDLLASSDLQFMCDAVCLLYDVTDEKSFQYCIEIQKKLNPEMTVIVVATKSDESAVQQHCGVQPAQFCKQNDFHSPLQFSHSSKDFNLYQTIAEIAAMPKKKELQNETSWVQFCFKFGVVSLLAAVIGYGCYKFGQRKVFTSKS